MYFVNIHRISYPVYYQNNIFDPQLLSKSCRFSCNGKCIMGGVSYHKGTGKAVRNRPAEMLHSRRRVKQDYFIREKSHMTKNRGKECIFGTKTPASGLADPPHDKKAKVICNTDREAIDDIADIRIQGEEPPRGNSLAGTGFFPQVIHALRDRNYLFSILLGHP